MNAQTSAGNRWLVVQAGGHLVALPAHQVCRVEQAGQQLPADAEAAPVDALAGCLGETEEPAGGFVVWLRGDGAGRGLRVRTVLDFVEGPGLLPLPGLLRQAMGTSSPVIGVLPWQDRVIPVVDPGRLSQQTAPDSPGEATIP